MKKNLSDEEVVETMNVQVAQSMAGVIVFKAELDGFAMSDIASKAIRSMISAYEEYISETEAALNELKGGMDTKEVITE